MFQLGKDLGYISSFVYSWGEGKGQDLWLVHINLNKVLVRVGDVL